MVPAMATTANSRRKKELRASSCKNTGVSLSENELSHCQEVWVKSTKHPAPKADIRAISVKMVHTLGRVMAANDPIMAHKKDKSKMGVIISYMMCLKKG